MKDEYKDKGLLITELKELRGRLQEAKDAAAELQRSCETLRASEARLRQIYDEAPVGFHEIDREGRITRVNRTELKMMDYAAGEMLGQPPWKFVVEEKLTREVILARLAGDVSFHETFERTYRRKDGGLLPVLTQDRLLRDESGKIVGIHTTVEDITQRRQTEEALKKSEEQLRQWQKVEAIGRLAGGVAHDFNNLMMTIKNCGDLLVGQFDPGDSRREEVEEIRRAADRATALTRQLLAFGRRQVLQPQIVDLNATVTAMSHMLRRLIGEDIDLITALAPALGAVRVDRGQIEQVLMNLVVNARDAIFGGGKITIETANASLDGPYAQTHVSVRPGPYVLLAVSDTGCGMDGETRSHLFEPFFTTKEKGKGTGLGLSTAYGIVKQSGGNIWVYSEPGQGTTFKVYLPRLEGKVCPPVEAAPLPSIDSLGGSETILLVEDEEAVRRMISRILQANGYKVLEARQGVEALQVAAEFEAPIHLLVTDVVITKGSGRIAEVAARFTLDAMPGKQMAIDADLNAGAIDDKEARKRRAKIAQEADFYGAMDGASKFVRGEAVAGIIIILINIGGGFIIGVAQQNLAALTAAQTYTILTIGDALVSQIPALINSTAAGLIVSRATSDQSMGRELSRQFRLQPQAMGLSAAILFVLGLVPGLPHLPFIALALLMGLLTFLISRDESKSREKEETAAQKAVPPPPPEQVESLLSLDRLELEVGYGLIPIVDEEQNGDLLNRIRAIRRQFATELGVIIPPLRVRDNLQMKPGEYRILIKGNEVAKGEMIPGYVMALNPGDVKGTIDGIPTQEPVFQLPATWIPEKRKDEAQFAGYTVVDISTIIATNLTEVLRSHAEELLSRQDVQKLLDRLAQTYPKVVEELTPNLLPLGTIQKVLQNLLRERVSIRDLLTILETLADSVSLTKDPEILTEYVRQKLARTIVKQYETPEGVLPLITLDPKVEDLLREGIQRADHGSYLSLEPKVAQTLLTNINQVLDQATPLNLQPVILCSPLVRRHLKKLLERFLPQAVVLSHNELTGQTRIQSLGTVTLAYADKTV